MTGHPSFLQLDRHSLGAGDAATAEHLGGCARCRAHLDRLEQPLAVPGWARALDAERSRWPRWLRLPQALALGGLAAAAVALVALQPADELGTKGMPTVAVYVKHGPRIELWDGASALSPGDGVQLKVMPEGFRHLVVASIDGAALRELHHGPVPPRGQTLLPQSWTLDAQPGAENLLVVFSQSELSPAALRSVLEEMPRTRRLWTTRLTMVKSGRAP